MGYECIGRVRLRLTLKSDIKERRREQYDLQLRRANRPDSPTRQKFLSFVYRHEVSKPRVGLVLDVVGSALSPFGYIKGKTRLTAIFGMSEDITEILSARQTLKLGDKRAQAALQNVQVKRFRSIIERELEAIREPLRTLREKYDKGLIQQSDHEYIVTQKRFYEIDELLRWYLGLPFDRDTTLFFDYMLTAGVSASKILDLFEKYRSFQEAILYGRLLPGSDTRVDEKIARLLQSATDQNHPTETIVAGIEGQLNLDKTT